jgi:hypothetical protein
MKLFIAALSALARENLSPSQLQLGHLYAHSSPGDERLKSDAGRNDDPGGLALANTSR